MKLAANQIAKKRMIPAHINLLATLFYIQGKKVIDGCRYCHITVAGFGLLLTDGLLA
jgi:hypothetical protein